MIKRFIKELSAELGIAPPQVEFDTSHFPTQTTMAVINVNKRIIYVRRQELSPDYIFAIAHELRHQWQFDNQAFDFTQYKKSDELTLREYNLQPIELDANAYATQIMSRFGLRPLFKGFDDDVKQKIYDLAKKIKEG